MSELITIRKSLDVGFGEGGVPEYFARYCGKVTRSIPVQREFPFEDAQFDAVVMDGKAVDRDSVKEAHRVLKVGGVLVFRVPEKTKSQNGFTLADIYSIAREGFNLVGVDRPAWWKFGRDGRYISIRAQKKNWKARTNTYRPLI